MIGKNRSGKQMNYIGSKYRLSGFIKETIQEVAGGDLSGLVFCDLINLRKTNHGRYG